MNNQNILEINGESSAKAIFMEYLGSDYQIKNALLSNYDTYKEFARKNDNSKKWAQEICYDILSKIADGDTTDYIKKFDMVGNLTEYYFSAYLIAEPFVKAWNKVLETENKPVYVGCILTYLERYSVDSKNETAFIMSLIDKTEEYLKKYALEDFMKSRYVSKEGHFRELSSDIRRLAIENSVFNECGHSFVKTESYILDIIKDSLMNEWQDMDTVKGALSELNCTHGVQNDKIFLTGSSSAANYSTLHSWDIIEFAVVAFKEKEACLFRCKLRSDGQFSFDSYLNKYPILKEYFEDISAAINFYRNQKARASFFAEQGVNSFRDMPKWNNYESECKAKFFSQFPKVLRNVYARIPDCSIKNDITKLVDISEEMVGSYNVKDTDFAPPVTTNEIENWEKENDIRLPNEYKEFLMFANGVNLQFYINFLGLNSIGLCREYLDRDGFSGFYDIGLYSGGGATLCISEKDDLFYIWQDGEMNKLGNFKETIDYICDICSDN